jgi:hypothetical protein
MLLELSDIAIVKGSVRLVGNLNLTVTTESLAPSRAGRRSEQLI